MYALKTNRLSFKFKNQIILDDVNLAVPENSIFGYLGKNGAGKSTTIKLLLGLLNAPEDSIYFTGDRELKKNRSEILGKVGNLIESPCYYEELSGYDNLKYLDYIFKCGESRIRDVLRIIGLERHRHKKVKKYSSGMKQRLGIGIAIFHNPDLLILDEPLNGLDPEGIHEMRELIVNLKNEGKTIFLSSHILSEIEKICTHIGILDHGKLLYQGSLHQILSDHPDDIIIKTDNSPSARKIFTEHSIFSESISESLLLIKLTHDKDQDFVLNLLSRNSIDVSFVEKKHRDLESIFLHLIA